MRILGCCPCLFKKKKDYTPVDKIQRPIQDEDFKTQPKQAVGQRDVVQADLVKRFLRRKKKEDLKPVIYLGNMKIR